VVSHPQKTKRAFVYVEIYTNILSGRLKKKGVFGTYKRQNEHFVHVESTSARKELVPKGKWVSDTKKRQIVRFVRIEKTYFPLKKRDKGALPQYGFKC
jgi:hypothetical protein